MGKTGSASQRIEGSKGRHSPDPTATSYTYVWTWGAGFHGQLGHGLTRGRNKSDPVPRKLAFPPGVSICAVASVSPCT